MTTAARMTVVKDSNKNGKYEPFLGETSNFNSAVSRPCNINPDEMVEVPAGEFQMGCVPDYEYPYPYYYSCASDAQPLHTVYLDAFSLDKYEVTNAKYAECVELEGCTAPDDNEIIHTTILLR